MNFAKFTISKSPLHLEQVFGISGAFAPIFSGAPQWQQKTVSVSPLSDNFLARAEASFCSSVKSLFFFEVAFCSVE
jgi:hypothetical protein